MKAIIQCASRKRENAGSFRCEGKRVKFVASPRSAPQDAGVLYARPDDPMPGGGGSWRDHLVRYNQSGENPDSLLPSADLYRPPTYGRLARAEARGKMDLFILSAGWGLVRGHYLLPDYDITFSHPSDRWKLRPQADAEAYTDFNQLAEPGAVAPGERVVFFGGQAYLHQLAKLVKGLPTSVTAYRRVPLGSPAGADPIAGSVAPGSIWFVDFPTRRTTNWHYECAEKFVSALETRR
jgi:hypothetical protein